MKNNNKDNKNFVLVLLALIVLVVLFFPQIYKLVNKISAPKVNNIETEEKEEEKVTDEILESVHFPKMRLNSNSQNTYYSLDYFDISKMSNQDILVNAFLDMYEGNITSYEGYASCTSNPMQFSDEYLRLRIKNILGKNVQYNLEDFNVYDGSNYLGLWAYDANSSRFIYNGLCSSIDSSVKYYDIEQLIKYDLNDDGLTIYYYVGFAKVEGTSYTLYKEPSLQTVLTSGTINDVSELNGIFENISDKEKKIYKYVFNDTQCSYNEYCLYSGQWVDKF